MLNEHIKVLLGRQRPRTPIGVTLLASLMILFGILFVLAGLAFFFMGSTFALATSRENGGLAAVLAGLGAAAGVIFLVFGGLHAALAVGLLKLRNAARILTILLFGLSAAGACVGLIVTSVRFSGVALVWNITLIILDVSVLSYLLRPHVKETFER